MKRSIALFVASLLTLAEARYELQVRIYSFSNPGNQEWDGDNCDVNRSPCDVVFLFCLRTINSSATSNTCPLGRQSTEGSPIEATSKTFTIGQTIAGSVSNPVIFTGSSSWADSFQLMVRLDNDDHPNSDNLIDRVVVNMTLGVSDSFTSTVRYNGWYNRANMQMSFRVRCQTNYYGATCDRLCVPRDDSGGHYTCDEDGNRVCLSGYTDTSSLCTVPMCAERCVQGNCSPPGECNCFTGWTGALCNQCVPSTGCINGYCMAPGDCICNEGYSGTLCQIDNDVCGHQQPCQNDGTCSNDGPGDYTCNCPTGITGADYIYEQDINECSNNLCENGATYINTQGSFTCTCAVGWTGDTCGDNIDECSSVSPCQNGATCTDCVPSGPGSNNTDNVQRPCVFGYFCDCAEGYFGDNCETEVDYCTPSPCANGSTCHDIVGGPGYFCECVAGFTGETCDIEIDECELNPCQNGGNCTDNIGSYTCDCAPGFTGTECHINIDECASSPCNANNSHECVDGINSYTCVCISGYTGQNCDSEVDKCALNMCFNGATCQTLFNDFLCECPAGFTGAQCDINIDDCHRDICLHGGTCMDEVNNYTCICLPKYTGRQCESDSPTCDDKPCGQDEFCVPLADDTFTCEPCIDGEAGCKIQIGGISPDQQTGNGTNTDNEIYSLIGGVAGGVLGAILLLLLFLILICCCLKCCPLCSRTKERQTDVPVQHHKKTSIESGIVKNPVYMGTSTFLSSQSNAVCSQTSDDMHYSQPYMWDSSSLSVPKSIPTSANLSDNDPTNKGDSGIDKDPADNVNGCSLIQNPVYVIAKEVQEQHNVHIQPPNLPPRNAGTLGVCMTKNMASTMIPVPPPSPTNPSDGHYEHIPGAF